MRMGSAKELKKRCVHLAVANTTDVSFVISIILIAQMSLLSSSSHGGWDHSVIAELVARALGAVSLPTTSDNGVVLRDARSSNVTTMAEMGNDDGTFTSGGGCRQNCTVPCPNATTPCVCPCGHDLHSDPSLSAAFASISFLFFLVATIQLILCMVHDALKPLHTTNHTRPTPREERWRRAFSLTVQKSLLGAIIGATGTRAIYYTVQGYIEEKWAEILLHVYYPALLSAFSLLILFWAEIFYQATTGPSENHVFLKKHKYSLIFFTFNAVVYLLFLAEVVATPLVHDDAEQVRKSGIIGIIFAVLLLLMLVGFLHLAIRLFFRPDWQPLVFQLEALKINLKQHTLSCLGIVTNALMQALIISLLVFNMVNQLKPVDHYSQHIASLIIRITELVMPVWFCCSLWNFKKPTSLWILNPRLLIQQLELGGTEREQLVRNRDRGGVGGNTYGSTECGVERSIEGISVEEGYCWVCQDRSPEEDLIQPCRCLLHRRCIQRWVTHRVSNSEVSGGEVMKCQVCREKYYTKKSSCWSAPLGLPKIQWAKIAGVLSFLVLSGVISLCVVKYSQLSSSHKVAIVVILAFADVALLKVFGCSMIWLRRKGHSSKLAGEITDRPQNLAVSHGNYEVIPKTTPPLAECPSMITPQIV